jgi:hypothetical protein
LLTGLKGAAKQSQQEYSLDSVMKILPLVLSHPSQNSTAFLHSTNKFNRISSDSMMFFNVMWKSPNLATNDKQAYSPLLFEVASI